ncbi:hypothetical protein [Streptomyces albipurpureus]|uniref:Uncharacterized protein n=1 Tax=Streptomyces albipurpureus TaxID=2897419 RepID=A0ABT0UNB9_9ACTN|nr:hypothetical protein [Streptomyces sp. CWNU-1]MCM2389721.1 hypothetical protein [Streptomyces sp. CWNU-1]
MSTRIGISGQTTSAAAWAWPVDLAGFDRRGLLTEAEAGTLQNLGIEQIRRGGLTASAPLLRPAARVVRPLADCLEALHWSPDQHQRRFARDAAELILVRCGALRRAFWGWSEQDWVDLIDADGAEFRRSWGGQIGPNARPFVIAYAYLLGGFTAFDRLGRFRRSSLAHRVFGAGCVEDAVRHVCKILAEWGYRRDAERLTSVICQVLLLNRSPYLEDLSTDAFATLRVHPAMSGQWGKDLYGLHRAVAALGYAEPPPSGHTSGPAAMEGVPARGRTGSSAGTRRRPSRPRSATATAACSPISAAGWPLSTLRIPNLDSGPARPARPGSPRWTG